jgi:asparagine synthase (glutamine-hydrolysing)
MNGMGFLGGMMTSRPAAADDLNPSRPGATWHWQAAGHQLLLRVWGGEGQIISQGGLALLLRGVVDDDHAPGLESTSTVGHRLLDAYARHARLPLEHLDGSFALALLDGYEGRILLYRNLVGHVVPYYRATPEGLLFCSNLARLVDAAEEPVLPNEAALPAYFVYRFVPGRETLFQDCNRLLPGQLLSYERGHARLIQVASLTSLGGTPPERGSEATVIDETMTKVLHSYASHDPRAVNLLSGGVDSSFVQVKWNEATRGAPGRPRSVSLEVRHPRTRGETEYALSASRWFGTDHSLVTVDSPYIDYLTSFIAETGEPPNHVQAAYYLPLAAAMSTAGHRTGLCGQGADGLFGLSSAYRLWDATLLRTLLPFPSLRKFLLGLAGMVGLRSLTDRLQLANDLYCWDQPRHPINEVVTFTEPEGVQACFGTAAWRNALAFRRALLEPHAVSSHPLARFHAMALVGDGVDSAGLWNTAASRHGVELIYPYLDSRFLRVILGLDPSVRFRHRKPKTLLKGLLEQYAPKECVHRKKLSFGQPIFEWLSPGGQLRPHAERIGDYPFVPRSVRLAALAEPGWFLYSLLCYDVWHKLFISRELPRENSILGGGERMIPARGRRGLASTVTRDS